MATRIHEFRAGTARCADWHLPINLGTDAALALGMMHVIINENLHDAEYVSRHTVGFEELRKRVQDYSPQRVAQWTGIAAEDVPKLFQPDFSRKKKKSGLGLAIVLRIVKDHNGSIRVEQNTPRGARFILELPLAAKAVQSA